MPEIKRPLHLLDKARRLVATLAENRPMSPAQIADAIGIPRSTAYRLVEGLVAIDLVYPTTDDRFALSHRWLNLADAVTSARTEWAPVREALALLTERTGCTTFLTVPYQGQAMCTDWVRGRGIELLILTPGGTLPLHAGAAGRLLLAYADPAEIDRYLSAAPFDRSTPYTLSTAEEIRADLELIRRRGYALSEEDVNLGVGAIGVPVRDNQDTVVGCLSVGALIDEIRQRRGELVTELRRLGDLRIAA